MSERWYIYALCRPDGDSFYFGKTRNPKKRAETYKAETRARHCSIDVNRDTHYNLLRELDGKWRMSVLLWTDDKNLASFLEKYLIMRYDGLLTNSFYRHREGRINPNATSISSPREPNIYY